MIALLFPGQGSQAVGMGKELYDNFTDAKAVFEEVNEALHLKLTDIMFNGPENLLLSTENAQPAIMAVSMAFLKVLEKEFNIKDRVSYVAGHSLGEYSALCAAGVFDITTVAKLLKIRGEAMLSCSPMGFGGMVAVVGIDNLAKVEEMILACKVANEICVLANDNCAGQIVISGHAKSIANIVARGKEFGAKLTVKLPVSGSFHSPLMQKASEMIAESLNSIKISDASIPLISNVSATEVKDKNSIKALLVEQVVKGVRWRESMLYLLDKKVDTVIEIGWGSVLTGLMKRISPTVKKFNIQSASDISSFINSI